ERELLESPFCPEFLQSDLIDLPRSAQRRTTAIVHVQSLDFDLWWNSSGLKSERGNPAPICGHPITNRLSVTFDTREFDFQVSAIGQRMNVKAFHRRWRCRLLVRLEWNHLEWNSKYFCDFLV